MEFKGKDDFTGIEYSFRLSDIELRDGMIICNIQTDMGVCRIGEHVQPENNHVDRTDSNVRINDIENLENIFDLSEKPGLMPAEEYLPLDVIYDALDYELNLKKLN